MAQAKLHRWSYSLWDQFKKCPRSVFYGKLLKVEQPAVPAMIRGDTIHKKAEHFLRGNIKGVPRELSKLEKLYLKLKSAKPAHIEEFMSVNNRFRPVKDGLRQGWFTLKADAMLKPKKHGVGITVDHKSGKIYENKALIQGELSSLIQALNYPDADLYTTEFWYVDQGEVLTFDFTPEYLESRIPYWIEQGLR